jgi:hypothetical protein
MKVFIFGSNGTGFHGAGSAGYAFRGDSKNNWRECLIMKEAIKHGPGFKGKIAEFGKARGFQTGTLKNVGSYAIQTVIAPGKLRSIPLKEIESQIDELILFMRKNPSWEFCLTPIGTGYAGYKIEEIKPLLNKCLNEPNCRMAANEQKLNLT